jgi:hypothetical protein
VPLLFADNTTKHERLFPGQKNESAYVKDGINDSVVQGNQGAVNPEKQGTKAAAHYRVTIAPGQSVTVRLRMNGQSATAKSGKPKPTHPASVRSLTKLWPSGCRRRMSSTAPWTPASISPDAVNVMRQAIASMLWSKQFFFFDGDNWLDEHHSNPLHTGIEIPGTQSGSTCLTRTSSGCRTSGSTPVRCLGSGLPHAPALDCGPRFRQGANGTDVPRSLPAPQRRSIGRANEKRFSLQLVPSATVLVLGLLLSAVLGASVHAQQASRPAQPPTSVMTDQELAKSVRNPFEDFGKLPIQSTTRFQVGHNHNAGDSLNIEPLVPFSLSAQWDLIARPSLTVTYLPSPHEQFGNRRLAGFFFSDASQGDQLDLGRWADLTVANGNE